MTGLREESSTLEWRIHSTGSSYQYNILKGEFPTITTHVCIMKCKGEPLNVQTCAQTSYNLTINRWCQNYIDSKFILDMKCSNVSDEGSYMKHIQKKNLHYTFFCLEALKKKLFSFSFISYL